MNKAPRTPLQMLAEFEPMPHFNGNMLADKRAISETVELTLRAAMAFFDQQIAEQKKDTIEYDATETARKQARKAHFAAISVLRSQSLEDFKTSSKELLDECANLKGQISYFLFLVDPGLRGRRELEEAL